MILYRPLRGAVKEISPSDAMPSGLLWSLLGSHRVGTRVLVPMATTMTCAGSNGGIADSKRFPTKITSSPPGRVTVVVPSETSRASRYW